MFRLREQGHYFNRQVAAQRPRSVQLCYTSYCKLNLTALVIQLAAQLNKHRSHLLPIQPHTMAIH